MERNMIGNFITIALRNFKRHKSFTILNGIGLAVGLTCFILIGWFVFDECTYDSYHTNLNQMYRVSLDAKVGQQSYHGSQSSPPLAPALMEEIPEIEHASRLRRGTTKLISNKTGNRHFNESRTYFADNELFSILTIPFIAGDPSSVLNREYTMVITQSMAQKYFGDEAPIGKILTVDSETDYEVVGVVEDAPANSFWHYDFFLSFHHLFRNPEDMWFSDNITTYLLLQKGADPQAVTDKINELFVRHGAGILKEALGLTYDEWIASGNKYQYYLTPYRDIYLHDTADWNGEAISSMKYIYIFGLVAFFVLLIACVNFMNLTTAKSMVRAKEIGVRKVLGSHRQRLIQQFLIEAVLMSIIAMIFAVILIAAALPWFNSVTGKGFSAHLLYQGWMPLILLLLAVGVGLFAGSYSAISMSGFAIIPILKGSLFGGRQRSWMRNALVLFQFTISIAIFICTFVVRDQLHFIQSKDLGFDKEQVLVVDRAYSLGTSLDAFKEELLCVPGVQSVSKTFSVPGKSTDGSSFKRIDSPADELLPARIISGDEDLLNTLGIELAEGRYFDANHDDTNNIVISEQAVKRLGLKQTLGAQIYRAGYDERLTVIGVTKDAHWSDLHEEVPALIIMSPGRFYDHYLALRIDTDDVGSVLHTLQSKWKELVPEQPLEYFFLDALFEQIHRSEQRISALFSVFSTMAIVIACLGLFGLAAFTTQQRSKEIGVRKVLGASTAGIMAILFKEFSRWVLLANILAWPIAWYAMSLWLRGYSYHVKLNLLLFVAAGAITLIIAAITVFSQTVKAAMMNPVKTLSYE
jgi:putative ABC transport system permease protein